MRTRVMVFGSPVDHRRAPAGSGRSLGGGRRRRTPGGNDVARGQRFERLERGPQVVERSLALSLVVVVEDTAKLVQRLQVGVRLRERLRELALPSEHIAHGPIISTTAMNTYKRVSPLQ